jgi:hypothetical protein
MWTAAERRVFARLTSAGKIRDYLDTLAYSTDPIYRCPRRVLRDRVAHCVDGGLFAAAALRRLGYPPLVTWIWAENDDGHLLALWRERGLWGAVGKSNWVTLRWRPPVYRSLRELMMSCFHDYFNTKGEYTMRSYTAPLNLSRFDGLGWESEDGAMPPIVDVAIDRQRVFPLVTRRELAALTRHGPVDPRSIRGALVGAEKEGLFKPA